MILVASVLLLAVLGLAACGDSASSGPELVTAVAGQQAYGEGWLRITPECIVLEGNSGDQTTLAFNAGWATYDAKSETIVYLRPKRGDRPAETLLLKDGDWLETGGAGFLHRCRYTST